jgi:hypothetical protein
MKHSPSDRETPLRGFFDFFSDVLRESWTPLLILGAAILVSFAATVVVAVLLLVVGQTS